MSDVPIPKVDLKIDVTVSEQSVDKLVEAVIDTFSPLTESLGLLGNVVRLARVELATAITHRAKQIADANGLKLIAPPLKFLAPFYEKASTEDPRDKSLVEMWAQLLASAGQDYDAKYLRYTSLLAEMSVTQGQILDGMVRNYGGDTDTDLSDIFLDIVQPDLINYLRRLTTTDANDIFDAVMSYVGKPGVSIVYIGCDMLVPSGMWDWTEDSVYSDKRSLDFDVLRSHGLIEKISTDFVECQNAHVSVKLYRITELGWDFWKSCSGVPTAPAAIHP